MMDLKAQLAKPIGPLPLGAWLIIVGGAGAYAAYLRKATPASDAQQFPEVDTPAGVAEGPGGLIPSAPYQTTSGNSTPTQEIDDNDSWGRVAINYLVAKGINPAVAQAAVGNYLNSEPLSAVEWSIISMAIAFAGSPPVLPPSGNKPPGTPGPNDPLPFTAGYWHTVANGVVGRATPAPTGAAKKTLNSGSNLWITGRSGSFSHATDGLYYPTSSLAPGKYSAAPAKRATVYVVPSTTKTVGSIAKLFRISATALFNANRTTLQKQKVSSPGDRTKVRKGTRLTIPAV